MTRHRILTARRLTDADDGSIPLLTLVIVVSMMLGAVLLSSILTQSRSTAYDAQRVRALDAAQAGVDVALAHLRSVTVPSAQTNKEPVGGGDDTDSTDTTAATRTVRELPCRDAPWTGAADATGTAGYSVAVACYAAAPDTSTSCTGAAAPDDDLSTPRYVQVISTGRDGDARRTICATYVVRIDDTPTPGGQIRSASTSDCLDAGADPRIGTAVVLDTCATTNPAAAGQAWAYRLDLSVELVPSGATTSTGLCLASDARRGYVALTACVPFSPRQQWVLDDAAHLRPARSGRLDARSFCLQAPAQGDVAPRLRLEPCQAAQTWTLAPTTGTGMAGAENQQLVHGGATCLSVPGERTDGNVVLHPCIQSPVARTATWNQVFVPSPALQPEPTPTLLTTEVAGSTYCLRSPLMPGGYPVLDQNCPDAPDDGSPYTWTVAQQYTDETQSTELPYAQRYTVKDSSGFCLGSPPADGRDDTDPTALVATCDGSTAQKWNAAPGLDAPVLVDTHELSR